MMGLCVVDAEGKTRLLSFQISPGNFAVVVHGVSPGILQVLLSRRLVMSGHTKNEWLRLFNNTEAFVCRARTAIVHCDGEQAIKDAFYESKVMSEVTKQTCTRHAAWTTGIGIGKEAAEKYHNRCANASCEAEFIDKYLQLRKVFLSEGKKKEEVCICSPAHPPGHSDTPLTLTHTQEEIMRFQRDRKDAIFDFDEVMMNGQLATGIIEGVGGGGGASTGWIRG